MTENIETLRQISAQLDEAQKNVQSQIKDIETKELIEKMGPLGVGDFSWSVNPYGWTIDGTPKTESAKEYCKAVQEGALDSIPQLDNYGLDGEVLVNFWRFEVALDVAADFTKRAEILSNLATLLGHITKANAWKNVNAVIEDAENSVEDVEREYLKVTACRDYHLMRRAIVKGDYCGR